MAARPSNQQRARAQEALSRLATIIQREYRAQRERDVEAVRAIWKKLRQLARPGSGPLSLAKPFEREP